MKYSDFLMLRTSEMAVTVSFKDPTAVEEAHTVLMRELTKLRPPAFTDAELLLRDYCTRIAQAFSLYNHSEITAILNELRGSSASAVTCLH